MTDELLPGTVCRLDLGRVNAYLVDDGETTLIDAGTPNAVDDPQLNLVKKDTMLTTSTES